MESKDRVILDSSVFVAFYIKDDAFHEQAINLLLDLDKATILVPYCVVQEVSTVLTYRLGKAKALQFLSDVETASNTSLVEDELYPEIEAFKKVSTRLSFTDVALMHLADKYDARLFTFDKDLLKLYGRK